MKYLKYLWIGTAPGSPSSGFEVFIYMVILIMEIAIILPLIPIMYHNFMIFLIKLKLKILCKFKYEDKLETISKLTDSNICMSCFKKADVEWKEYKLCSNCYNNNTNDCILFINYKQSIYKHKDQIKRFKIDFYNFIEWIFNNTLKLLWKTKKDSDPKKLPLSMDIIKD